MYLNINTIYDFVKGGNHVQYFIFTYNNTKYNFNKIIKNMEKICKIIITNLERFWMKNPKFEKIKYIFIEMNQLLTRINWI